MSSERGALEERTHQPSQWRTIRYYRDQQCRENMVQVYATYTTSTSTSACRYSSAGLYYTVEITGSSKPDVPSGWGGYETRTSSCGALSTVVYNPLETCSQITTTSVRLRCVGQGIFLQRYYGSSCGGDTYQTGVLPFVNGTCIASQTSGYGWTAGVANGPCSTEKLEQTVSGPSGLTEFVVGQSFPLSRWTSDSENTVTLQSLTPAVCAITGGTSISFRVVGQCILRSTAAGNAIFEPLDSNLSYDVVPAPYLVTNYGPNCSSSGYLVAYPQTALCQAQPSCYRSSTFVWRNTTCAPARPDLAPGWVGLERVASCVSASIPSLNAWQRATCVSSGSSVSYYVTCSATGGLHVTRFSGSACWSRTGSSVYLSSSCSSGSEGLGTALLPSDCPTRYEQSIFENPGRDTQVLVGASESCHFQATASSGRTVVATSQTPTICNISSSGLDINFLDVGECVVRYTEAGSTEFLPAPPVTLAINVTLPTWRITTYFTDSLCRNTSNTRVSAQIYAAVSCFTRGCTFAGSGMYSTVACERGLLPVLPSGFVGRSYHALSSTCSGATSVTAFPAADCVKYFSYYYKSQCAAGVVQTNRYTSSDCSGSISSTDETSLTCGRLSSSASEIGFAEQCAAKFMQELSISAFPDRYVEDGLVSFSARSSAGLSVSVSFANERICRLSASNVVQFLAPGLCEMTFSAPETQRYFAASSSVNVTVIPKPWTIYAYSTSSSCSEQNASISFWHAFRSTSCPQAQGSCSPGQLGGPSVTVSCFQPDANATDSPPVPDGLIGFVGFKNESCSGQKELIRAFQPNVCVRNFASLPDRSFPPYVYASCTGSSVSISGSSNQYCASAPRLNFLTSACLQQSFPPANSLGKVSTARCTNDKLQQSININRDAVVDTVRVGSTISTESAFHATSGLAVLAESLTPNICQLLNGNSTLSFTAVGSCNVRLTQAGDERFGAADAAILSVDVSAAIWRSTWTYTDSNCLGNATTLISERLSAQQTCSPRSCRWIGSNVYATETCSEKPSPPVGWIGYEEATSCVIGTSSYVRAVASPGECVRSVSGLYRFQCANNTILADWMSQSCLNTPASRKFIGWNNCSQDSVSVFLRGFSSDCSATKFSQEISIFGTPESSVVGSSSFVQARSSSLLDVDVVSETPLICAFEAATSLRYKTPGECRIVASQTGNNLFAAADSATTVVNVRNRPWRTVDYYRSSSCLGTPFYVSASASSSSCFASSTCRYSSSIRAYYKVRCIVDDFPSVPYRYAGIVGYSADGCANSTQNSFQAYPAACTRIGSSYYTSQCVAAGVIVRQFTRSSCSGSPVNVLTGLFSGCGSSQSQSGVTTFTSCTSTGKLAQNLVLSVPSSANSGTTLTLGSSNLYSSSGLQPTVTVTPASVCVLQGMTITFRSGGVCSVRAEQLGSEFFNAASPQTRSINVRQVVVQWQISTFYTSSRCSTSSTILYRAEKVSGCTPRSCIYDPSFRRYKSVVCTSTLPETPAGFVGFASYIGDLTPKRMMAEKACEDNGDLVSLFALPSDSCVTFASGAHRADCASGQARLRTWVGTSCSGSNVQTQTASVSCLEPGPVGVCPAGGRTPVGWKKISFTTECGEGAAAVQRTVIRPDLFGSCREKTCTCSNRVCYSVECLSGSQPPSTDAGLRVVTYSGVSCGSDSEASIEEMETKVLDTCITTGESSSERTSCESGTVEIRTFSTANCEGVATRTQMSAGQCSRTSSVTSMTAQCNARSSAGAGSGSGSSGGASIGVIIGCSVAGALVLIAVVLIIIIVTVRKRGKNTPPPSSNNERMTPLGRRIDDEIVDPGVGPHAEQAAMAADAGVQYPNYSPPPYHVAAAAASPSAPPPPYGASAGYVPTAPPISRIHGNSMYGTMRASEK